jgi:hypothetical protein
MSPNEIATNPRVRALLAESDSIVNAAVVVQTVADYEHVADELKRIKDAQSKLDTLRRSFTVPLDQAKRAVMDWFRNPEYRLECAEKIRKAALIAYDEEQKRRAAEAQAKLDEQARRERERLAEQARKAVAAGKYEKADELSERAATVVAPIAQVERPEVSGLSARDNWRAEVTDFALLVRAVADGKAPYACLEANEPFLNRQARALKSELDYAGVRAIRERGLAARRQ